MREPLTEEKLLEAMREIRLLQSVDAVRDMVREMVATGGSYQFNESRYLPSDDAIYILRLDCFWDPEAPLNIGVICPPGQQEKAVEVMGMIEESVQRKEPGNGVD